MLKRFCTLPTAPECAVTMPASTPAVHSGSRTMRNNVGPRGENLDVIFTDGVLYRIDANGTATEWKRNIGISNTVAWSPDHKIFYFGDSIANNNFQLRTSSDRLVRFRGEQPLPRRHELGAPDGQRYISEGFLMETPDQEPGALIRVAPDGRIDQIVPPRCHHFSLRAHLAGENCVCFT